MARAPGIANGGSHSSAGSQRGPGGTIAAGARVGCWGQVLTHRAGGSALLGLALCRRGNWASEVRNDFLQPFYREFSLWLSLSFLRAFSGWSGEGVRPESLGLPPSLGLVCDPGQVPYSP